MLYLVTQYAVSDMYDEYTETMVGIFETKELAEKCIAAMIEEAENAFKTRSIEENETDRFEKLKGGYKETVDYVTLCCDYDITEIELNKIII